MQDKPKTKTTDEVALLIAQSGDSLPSSAQERIAALLEAKLSKEASEEADAIAQFQAFRNAQIAEVRRNAAEKEANQAACPHMKPNFRPAIGGQKDHKGNYHFLCQYCQKEFGNDLPYHLRIPNDMIGGPQ